MLRMWREQRRMSQLALANEAEVSARHISFIETGRARPSEAMVLRLAERLDVPVRERNTLLMAAGYAPVYSETVLDEPAMAPLLEVIEELLRAYEPYPALVINAGYDIVAANDAVNILLEGVAPHLLDPPSNVVRLALHPDGLAKRITNSAEVRGYLLGRLARDAELWQLDDLRKLYAEVSAYPEPGDGDPAPSPGPGSALAVPLRFRSGDAELAFVSTVTTFNAPLDVTVSELAIETFLPADGRTSEALRSRIG